MLVTLEFFRIKFKNSFILLLAECLQGSQEQLNLVSESNNQDEVDIEEDQIKNTPDSNNKDQIKNFFDCDELSSK